jgi:hypothetical protein
VVGGGDGRSRGFFLHVGRLPPPPGIPTVRAFQRAQAAALIPWLRDRSAI